MTGADSGKLQIHRDAILSAQGASFFGHGQFVQAAQSYAQSTTAPFKEVALKFVDAGERDALRYYLRSRLGSTRKTVGKHNCEAAGMFLKLLLG